MSNDMCAFVNCNIKTKLRDAFSASDIVIIISLTNSNKAFISNYITKNENWDICS